MQHALSYLSIIASTAAGLLFFLLVTLRNERSYANRLLSPFVLTFCMVLLQSQAQSGYSWALYELVCASFFFLAGPSLFTYARYLFKQQSLKSGDLLHLFPFIAMLIMSSLTLSRPALFEDFWWWQQRILYLQLAGYCIVVLQIVKQTRRSVLDEFSAYQHTHFNWISLLCFGVIILLALDTLMGIAIQLLAIQTPVVHNIMMTAIAIVIIGLTFHALKQPLIIHGASFASRASETEKKYHKSSLSKSQASYYINKLKEQMAQQQYFLNSALTLTDLAGELELSRHHLSQIINEQLSTTFYDYINALRVEQAQSLLRNDQMSVTDICYASGFANKTTFNSAFKKLTHQTPTQWRKTQNTKNTA